MRGLWRSNVTGRVLPGVDWTLHDRSGPGWREDEGLGEQGTGLDVYAGPGGNKQSSNYLIQLLSLFISLLIYRV